MLPKHSRLTSGTIEKYLVKARRMQTSSFLVMYAKVSSQKTPKISITASKKVAPTAVLRNKLRRRGYAAAKELIHRLSPESVVLISYKVPASDVPIPELAREMDEALSKTGLYAK